MVEVVAPPTPTFQPIAMHLLPPHPLPLVHPPVGAASGHLPLLVLHRSVRTARICAAWQDSLQVPGRLRSRENSRQLLSQHPSVCDHQPPPAQHCQWGHSRHSAVQCWAGLVLGRQGETEQVISDSCPGRGGRVFTEGTLQTSSADPEVDARCHPNRPARSGEDFQPFAGRATSPGAAGPEACGPWRPGGAYREAGALPSARQGGRGGPPALGPQSG